MAGPGSREAALTADYNAEMIEQIARFPRVRDRALFVGTVDDVVDLDFGPGLPNIRDWTARHFAFPGYILPVDPAELADRGGLRARLGFRPDERVVLATVGGSGVGHHLLRRVVAAAPLRHHFEQNIHGPHRLARYGAGVRMEYHQTDPEALAHAIADGLERPVLYRDVETDGARRAAAAIGELL